MDSARAPQVGRNDLCFAGLTVIRFRAQTVSKALRAAGSTLLLAILSWFALAFRSWLRLRHYNAALLRLWSQQHKVSALWDNCDSRPLVDTSEHHSIEAKDVGVHAATEKLKPEPHSARAWSIAGDSLAFAAAGRAIMLQLAHPFVGQAMKDHSYILKDPARAVSLRFFRIFGIMFPIWFGSTDEKRRHLIKFHRMHRNVQGVLSGDTSIGPFLAGTRYSAGDLRAMWWVNATLIESAIAAFALIDPGRIHGAALDEYWVYYARPSFTVLGIPDKYVPETWTSFLEEYMALWREELGVGGAACEVLDALQRSGDTRGAYSAMATRSQLALARAWLPSPVQGLFPRHSQLMHCIGSLALHLEIGLYSLCRLFLPAKLHELSPYVEAKVRDGEPRSFWHTLSVQLALRIVYSILGFPKGLQPDWS